MAHAAAHCRAKPDHPQYPDSPEAFLAEPLLQRFSINPDTLTRGWFLVPVLSSATFALIETKTALWQIEALSAELSLTREVRIHWTGCPNSCGQPQVADIGLMGTKARKMV